MRDDTHIDGCLVLENGAVFRGRAFGAVECDDVSACGEVVFNTAQCGYQEALTDPSYAGQVLVMTAPMMGNYGTCDADLESGRAQVAGFVVRELSGIDSNYRSDGGLGAWLKREGIFGLEGLDTRALVRMIRKEGAMRGILCGKMKESEEKLAELAGRIRKMEGLNLAKEVSPAERFEVGGAADGDIEGKKCFRVLALDCGAKQMIYQMLMDRGCSVTAMPFDTSAEDIRKFSPDGLFISNGPGDPDAVRATIATLREVAGEQPTFGICMGHQLLALAMGAKTYKLGFGHRGANQPVREERTGQVLITSQNHGFCVEEESLAGIGCEVTHVHLNDGTVAGFRHKTKPVFGVQFHPEASPGPHDSGHLFDAFVGMMRGVFTTETQRAQRGREGDLFNG